MSKTEKIHLKKEIINIFKTLTDNQKLLENAKRDLGRIMREYEILSKETYRRIKYLCDVVQREERITSHQAEIMQEMFGAMARGVKNEN